MRLLEHQSKSLLSSLGINCTSGTVVDSATAARAAAEMIGGPCVIKAQLPFGGRGKAGAVRFADSPAAAGDVAQNLLGTTLRGATIATLLVEPKVTFGRELYAGVAWDNASRAPVGLLGSAGGVEVERSAAQVARRTFDPCFPLRAFEGREMARRAGLSGKPLVAAGALMEKLAAAFVSLDAVLVEINPLVELEDGSLLALDAHIEIDDDAAYRQKWAGEIEHSSGARTATALEREAAKIDAMDHRGVAGRVVEFDGDLALLIGGGGASLTVFDAIRRYGGRPANYCEVGGNPTEEKVALLTALLLGKPGVRKIAVIMNVVNNTRADVMARGVIDGVRRANRKPADAICLFRIPGSWESEAKQIMADAGVETLGREISLDECARLAVERMRDRAA